MKTLLPLLFTTTIVNTFHYQSPTLLFTNAAATDDECTLSSPIQLNEPYNVQLRYYSTSTHLTIQMTTDHGGYLGFGTTIDEYSMIPSDAVIGIGNPSFRVDRYDMVDKTDAGVLRMDAEYQTLVNASFVRDVDTGGRILTFTKLLQDEKSVEYEYENGIDATGRTTFIWAVGFSDVLGNHRYRGRVELPLKPCDVVVEDTSDDDSDDNVDSVVIITEVNANKAFVAHGILALMAVVLLLPIGIASSAARNSTIMQQPTTTTSTSPWKNSPRWMVLHQLCNGTSYLLFLILFVLSFAAQYYESDQNTDSPWNGHLESMHHTMGYAIFILMTLQVVIAIFRPSKAPINDGKEQGLEEGGTEHNDESFSEHDSSLSNPTKKAMTVTSVRRIWELKHLIVGYTLLALSLYQCHSGLKRLTLKGYTDYTIALWIYVSCFFALLIVGVLYLKRQ